MTGWNWAGRADSFRLDPTQYGGIAFHDDALTDCRWSPEPDVADSGRSSRAASMRCGCAPARPRTTFRSSSARAKPKAPLAVLMSTFTYLAYANERLGLRRADRAGDHRAYADLHRGRCRVLQAAGIRPVDLRPSFRRRGLLLFVVAPADHQRAAAAIATAATGITWGLPADLSLLWWLEHAGYDFEILTDHDLHAEGVDGAASVSRRHQLHASGVLFGANDGRDRRLSARRRPADLCRRQRLLLGLGTARGRAALHGGSQARQRLARLAGRPGRSLSGLHRRAVRAVALARPRAAEDRRRRLHLRRHGREPAVRTHAGFLSPPRGMDVRRHRPAGEHRRFRTGTGRRGRESRSTATIWRSARRRMPCCWRRRTAIPTTTRWSPRRSPTPSRDEAAPRIRWSGPTSPISPPPMTAPAFRSARSPGARRCRSTTATTMSQRSCATC